jgi:hypothetical protein
VRGNIGAATRVEDEHPVDVADAPVDDVESVEVDVHLALRRPLQQLVIDLDVEVAEQMAGGDDAGVGEAEARIVERVRGHRDFQPTVCLGD